MCGLRLVPLSFAPASSADVAMGIENRPELGCPGCGQCYEWLDSAGWGPVDSLRDPVASMAHRRAGPLLVG